MLVDIGYVGVQNSTFWKFKVAAVAVLEIHKRDIVGGQFLTNLHQICVLIKKIKYGKYKGHERSIIALFVNSRWRQHFWELKMG